MSATHEAPLVLLDSAIDGRECTVCGCPASAARYPCMSRDGVFCSRHCLRSAAARRASATRRANGAAPQHANRSTR